MRLTLRSICEFVLVAAIATLSACQTTQLSDADRFDQADTNGDGRLSRDEISDMLVTEVFNGRDTNGDGKLTKAEWLIPGDDAGNKVFITADTNGDGIVTLAEGKAAGRRIGVGDDFFKGADTNRDGYVDREEALVYYASKEGPVR